MKTSYEERAKKFIAEFAEYVEMCHDYDTYEFATYVFNISRHRAVKFAHGMTRAAFITSDYVVKIDCPEYEGCIERYGGCEREMEVYAKAVEDGFDFLFAKISCYEYNGKKYYIMPRVKGLRKCWDNAEYYICNCDALDWLYDNGITDLHNENYGWVNGKVVIFDYACHA